MADTMDSMNKEMSFTILMGLNASRVNIIKKKVYLLDVAINVHIV